jgi:type IV pilus assembly protein PilM
MANKNAVWGIDIGQCALKALRCTIDGDGSTIIADKYDVIEYPKILSASDADPEELVSDAIQQFLGRNSVVGDKVAISVAGQAGLSRFFKPPPVEVQTLPDIVKYEVKAQIPFPIEDVIWDWQQMGGTVVDGRTVDAEIGLFAMKRDAVFNALKPFDDADIDVDFVQLSPLSIFNVVCHDLIDEVPNPEDFDPENPPPSIVVMSMGTDTTDLVVTNGIRMWLRNIPIGGNHFTKQLSREMKLTQAKAEHLKRNARVSENPKAIFKAMRPVFTDFVNEVQRSLNFFQSNEKSAELSKIILLGNAAKLPGLRQYLAKQLEMDIGKVTGFEKLSGAEVTSQKSFQDNLLSFATCYGLCLQGLKKAQIKTNLLPREIVVERIVEAKKPWVLTAVCSAMAGLTLGYFFTTGSWHQAREEYEGPTGTTWKAAFRKVDSAESTSSRYITEDADQKALLDNLNRMASELTSASEQKSTWLELQSALSQAFPKDPRIEKLRSEGASKIDPQKIPFEDRKELYVDHIESMFVSDIDKWYKFIEPFHKKMRIDFAEEVKKAAAAGVNTDLDADIDSGEDAGDFGDEGLDEEAGDKTSGWVIEIKGHHFHNSSKALVELQAGKQYVLQTLIENLLNKENVELPFDKNLKFTYSDIGISFPTICWVSKDIIDDEILFDPATAGQGADAADGGMPGGMGLDDGMGLGGEFGMDGGFGGLTDEEEENENLFEVRRYTFVVQMAWTPRSESEILAAREERLKTAEEATKAKESDATEDDE